MGRKTENPQRIVLSPEQVAGMAWDEHLRTVAQEAVKKEEERRVNNAYREAQDRKMADSDRFGELVAAVLIGLVSVIACAFKLGKWIGRRGRKSAK